jgi:hypothetical protein
MIDTSDNKKYRMAECVYWHKCCNGKKEQKEIVEPLTQHYIVPTMLILSLLHYNPVFALQRHVLEV